MTAPQGFQQRCCFAITQRANEALINRNVRIGEKLFRLLKVKKRRCTLCVKILRRNQMEKIPSRRTRRFIQRSPKKALSTVLGNT